MTILEGSNHYFEPTSDRQHAAGVAESMFWIAAGENHKSVTITAKQTIGADLDDGRRGYVTSIDWQATIEH